MSKTSPVQPTAKRSSKGARQGARQPLALLLAVILAAGVAWYGYGHYQHQRGVAARERIERQGRTYTHRVAQALGAAVRSVATEAVMARAGTLLGGGQDQAARRAFLAGLERANSLVKRAWLLAPGTDEVDYTVRPPLGYASLALLRQAEKSHAVQPLEVQFFRGPDRNLSVLRAVPPGQAPSGYLLLALDTSVLQRSLVAARLPKGAYATLLQVIPGVRRLELSVLGDGAARRGTPTSTAPVPGTRFVLLYYAPTAEVDIATGKGALPPALVGAGVAVVMLLLFYAAFAVRRRRRVVDEPLPAAAAEQPVQPARSAESAVSMPEASPEQPAPEDGDPPPESIFREYDIRGVVGEALNAAAVRSIGRAIGSEAAARSQQSVVVGRDGRTSSEELAGALIEGLRASGREVIDIGLVPTPVLYFAAHHLGTTTGVMVTGSHNPPQYNGLKIMIAGETLHGSAIRALRERVVEGDFTAGDGGLQQADIGAEYIRRITDDIPTALGGALKIVVDCGNGAAGVMAPRVLRALGHEVIELYCEVDGRFPNHHPDPSDPKNLADLRRVVREQEAGLGLAFDGDGDRLGVVDARGRILWPDRQMMLYARDVLARNPGAAIVYDVKCSNRLGRVIERLGGKPIMWKSGHSLIKSKMQESEALLAGEMSGHIFFKERWYGFDDAIYAAARLVQIILGIGRRSDEIFDKLPGGLATPELRIELEEGEPERFMAELARSDPFPGAQVTTLDGLRADYADGWGLVRASNTTPSLVLRFEADNEAVMKRIQHEFRQVLLAVDAGLQLPF